MEKFEKYLTEAPVKKPMVPLQGKKMWPGEFKHGKSDPIHKSGDSKDTKGYRNLGYSNEWKETPDIVKKCREKDHDLSGQTVGKSLHKYSCPICKYSYQVDSSD
jgi:hypothetical protein